MQKLCRESKTSRVTRPVPCQITVRRGRRTSTSCLDDFLGRVYLVPPIDDGRLCWLFRVDRLDASGGNQQQQGECRLRERRTSWRIRRDVDSSTIGWMRNSEYTMSAHRAAATGFTTVPCFALRNGKQNMLSTLPELNGHIIYIYRRQQRQKIKHHKGESILSPYIPWLQHIFASYRFLHKPAARFYASFHRMNVDLQHVPIHIAKCWATCGVPRRHIGWLVGYTQH